MDAMPHFLICKMQWHWTALWGWKAGTYIQARCKCRALHTSNGFQCSRTRDPRERAWVPLRVKGCLSAPQTPGHSHLCLFCKLGFQERIPLKISLNKKGVKVENHRYKVLIQVITIITKWLFHICVYGCIAAETIKLECLIWLIINV